MIPENINGEHIQIFLLIFVRVTAIMTLLPIFGSQNVPIHLKAGFSFILSLLLFPLIPTLSIPNIDFHVPHFMVMVIKEVFVGITIGFASSLLFVSVQFAGRLIDTEMGFAFVQLIDPFTDAESTVTGQLQILLYSIVFLLVNGHYFLLLAVKKSFEIIPLFAASFPSGKTTFFLVTMVGGVFELAIRFAAPVYCVLLLTTLALGVVARTVPQINIYFVGLPLKIGLGLVTLAVVLPSLANLFQRTVDLLIQDIWKLLYTLA